MSIAPTLYLHPSSASGPGSMTNLALPESAGAASRVVEPAERREIARQLLNMARLVDSSTVQQRWDALRPRFSRAEREFVETRLARLAVRAGAPGVGPGPDLQSIIDRLLATGRDLVAVISQGEVVATGESYDAVRGRLDELPDEAVVIRVNRDGTLGHV